MRMRFQVVRLSGWRAVAAVLAGLIGLAAAAALAIVGFFFVVLPALVVGAIAFFLLPKAGMRSMGPAGDPDVIEGTFEVAPDDAKRLERQKPP